MPGTVSVGQESPCAELSVWLRLPSAYGQDGVPSEAVLGSALSRDRRAGVLLHSLESSVLPQRHLSAASQVATCVPRTSPPGRVPGSSRWKHPCLWTSLRKDVPSRLLCPVVRTGSGLHRAWRLGGGRCPPQTGKHRGEAFRKVFLILFPRPGHFLVLGIYTSRHCSIPWNTFLSCFVFFLQESACATCNFLKPFT